MLTAELVPVKIEGQYMLEPAELHGDFTCGSKIQTGLNRDTLTFIVRGTKKYDGIHWNH